MIHYKTLLKMCCLPVILPVFFMGCQSKHLDVRYAGWENVTLHATGLGAIQSEWSIAARVQAVQAAKVDAYAQLESQAMRLKTDHGMTVLELVEKNGSLRKKVSAFVRGAKIIQTQNTETGISIGMELFLGDGFKATLGLSQKRPSPSSGSQNGEALSH